MRGAAVIQHPGTTRVMHRPRARSLQFSDRNAPQKHVWRAKTSLPPPTTAARPRSCGDPARQSRWCGGGRPGSWPRLEGHARLGVTSTLGFNVSNTVVVADVGGTTEANGAQTISAIVGRGEAPGPVVAQGSANHAVVRLTRDLRAVSGKPRLMLRLAQQSASSENGRIILGGI